MAKAKCNHCKKKFTLESSRHMISNVEQIGGGGLLAVDGRYYCKNCRQTFCNYLIEKEAIMNKATELGMVFPVNNP